MASTSSTIKCAPSKNLNTQYPHFPTAHEMYAHLRLITEPGGEFVVRNFVGVIDDISVSQSLVETELFPKGALLYYTKKNMGWEYTPQEVEKWQSPERGGEQGDYREGVSRLTRPFHRLYVDPKTHTLQIYSIYRCNTRFKMSLTA
jgi:hypothetical protein